MNVVSGVCLSGGMLLVCCVIGSQAAATEYSWLANASLPPEAVSADSEQASAIGAGLGATPAPSSHWPMLVGAQFTYILQHQDTLHAPYSGDLSLLPEGDTQPTYTIGGY